MRMSSVTMAVAKGLRETMNHPARMIANSKIRLDPKFGPKSAELNTATALISNIGSPNTIKMANASANIVDIRVLLVKLEKNMPIAEKEIAVITSSRFPISTSSMATPPNRNAMLCNGMAAKSRRSK